MLKGLLVTIAVFGLAVSPIAAQAGTRAQDNAVSLDPLMQTHHFINEDEVEGAGLFADMPPALLLALLVGLAGIGLVIAGDSSENNASPGTGG